MFAAGSLRAAMTDIGEAFRQSGGGTVDMQFGASGLLRERLERGEAADVFASANLEHPAALAAAKRAGPVVLFARNRLCALAPTRLAVTPQNLLDKLLDPATKVGTSTPKADPSGDYAFELFAKAEALRPGARKTLEAKALKLTGGPGFADAAQGSQRVRDADGRAQGGHLPHLLHECARGAGRRSIARDDRIRSACAPLKTTKSA